MLNSFQTLVMASMAFFNASDNLFDLIQNSTTDDMSLRSDGSLNESLLLVNDYSDQRGDNYYNKKTLLSKHQDQSCECGCEMTVEGSGLLVIENGANCFEPYLSWILNAKISTNSGSNGSTNSESLDDRPTTFRISIKIVSLTDTVKDLLIIFDGRSRGSPILYDSRIPEKFSSSFASTGSDLRVDYHRDFNDGSTSADTRGALLAYDLIDAVKKDGEDGEKENPIATLLGITGFTGSVLLAMLLLYFCCFRPTKRDYDGGGGRESSVSSNSLKNGSHRKTTTLAAGEQRCPHGCSLRSAAGGEGNDGDEYEGDDATLASHSIPMLEVGGNGSGGSSNNHNKPPPPLLTPIPNDMSRASSSGSDPKTTRTIGTQLCSPALLLRHVNAANNHGGRSSSAANNNHNNHSSIQTMTSCSSGRGDSPLSFINNEFEYDYYDTVALDGGNPLIGGICTDFGGTFLADPQLLKLQSADIDGENTVVM